MQPMADEGMPMPEMANAGGMPDVEFDMGPISRD